MCGLVGYVSRTEAWSMITGVLRNLEYRGPDSAGMALGGDQIHVAKRRGGVTHLLSEVHPIPGTVGIGHTRWATHGPPSDHNAHPFVSCDGRFAVAHNGVIQNFQELRQTLTNHRHHFTSATDSEVIVHMMEECLDMSLLPAVMRVAAALRGSFTFLAIQKGTNEIAAARQGDEQLVMSNLARGTIVASDISSILTLTRRVTRLGDHEFARLTPDGFTIYDSAGSVIDRKAETIDWASDAATKDGLPHFMLKEVREEPDALGRFLTILASNPVKLAARADMIRFVGAGTSYHASLVGALAAEALLNVPAQAQYPSDVHPRLNSSGRVLYVFISQSGETADTLASIRRLENGASETVAITNCQGSTLTTLADHTLLIGSGPEVAVPATKTFVSTLAAIYSLLIEVGRTQGLLQSNRAEGLRASVAHASEAARQALLTEEACQSTAHFIRGHRSIYLAGQGLGYPLALEGALKIKETASLHAEGYVASELKHGALALAGEALPVILIEAQDSLQTSTLTWLAEVETRTSPTVLMCPASVNEVELRDQNVRARLLPGPRLPDGLSAVPIATQLQLLAYHLGTESGHDPDHPRNTAKALPVP